MSSWEKMNAKRMNILPVNAKVPKRFSNWGE